MNYGLKALQFGLRVVLTDIQAGNPVTPALVTQRGLMAFEISPLLRRQALTFVIRCQSFSCFSERGLKPATTFGAGGFYPRLHLGQAGSTRDYIWGRRVLNVVAGFSPRSVA